MTTLCVALLIVMMDMTVLILALPDLVADLGASSIQQLWIVDTYSLLLGGLIIPASALADRFGRRRVLLLGFTLFGVVSALVLAAGSAEFVIVLRALLGMSGAMIMPTTLAMIRTLFTDPFERSKALAMWALVASFGAVMGPLVGGAVLEFFDWRAAFLINVPFTIAAVVAGLLLLPESRALKPPPWDVAATLLSVIGMVAIVWGFKEVAHRGWCDLLAWAVLSAGLACMTLFVIRCLRSRDPMLDVRLFRAGPFSAGSIAALTSSLATAGFLLLVAQWLQLVAGYSPIVAGLALLPMALGGLASAPLAPAMAARFGSRAVMSGGLALVAVGLFLIPQDLVSYRDLVVPLVLVGIGTGPLATASAAIMASTPPDKAGNAAAIEETMYDIGSVAGVAVMGSVANAAYRSALSPAVLGGGIPQDAAREADRSLVAALEQAERLGLPNLASHATSAFELGFNQASVVAGLILAGGTVAVFLLVPPTFGRRG